VWSVECSTPNYFPHLSKFFLGGQHNMFYGFPLKPLFLSFRGLEDISIGYGFFFGSSPNPLAPSPPTFFPFFSLLTYGGNLSWSVHIPAHAGVRVADKTFHSRSPLFAPSLLRPLSKVFTSSLYELPNQVWGFKTFFLECHPSIFSLQSHYFPYLGLGMRCLSFGPDSCNVRYHKIGPLRRFLGDDLSP